MNIRDWWYIFYLLPLFVPINSSASDHFLRDLKMSRVKIVDIVRLQPLTITMMHILHTQMRQHEVLLKPHFCDTQVITTYNND